MSFSDYSGFKSKIAKYLARTDLTDEIPDFIQLAEIQLQRDIRTKKLLGVAQASTTASDSKVGLPTDFLEMRDIHIQSTNPLGTIKFKSPNNFYKSADTTFSGQPVYYTVLATEIQLAPIPDTSYTLQMLYYKSPTLLSDSNITNVFLTNYQDALLWAACAEGDTFLMNDSRLNMWAARYDRAILKINEAGQSSEFGGEPITMAYQ